MKGLTVDSSVIISSLLEQESRHREALEIWKRVLAGKNFAVMPFSVLVEVVAAIRRRTDSEELALEVKKTLLGVETVSFIVLDEQAGEVPGTPYLIESLHPFLPWLGSRQPIGIAVNQDRIGVEISS